MAEPTGQADGPRDNWTDYVMTLEEIVEDMRADGHSDDAIRQAFASAMGEDR